MMATCMNRIPSQYRFAVQDFYKDDDGWWICLRSDGPYILRGYASDYTIHEDTQLAALSEFKSCIERKEIAI